MFWNRSAADFYDLADATIRAIKQYDPTLVVGTCGVALPDNPPLPQPNPFSFGLIAELGRRGTPMDFFSFHGYTSNARWYATTATALRAALDAAWPSRRVKVHISEFFPCVLNVEQDTAYGAASFAGSLVEMVHAGVALATLYPLCSSGANLTDGRGWGLFDMESHPGVASWRPLTYAFAGFGELAQTAGDRVLPVALSPAPAAAAGFAVLAGRSEGGEGGSDGGGGAGAAVVKVLIASQSSNHTQVSVVLGGLGGGAAASAVPWAFRVMVIDNKHSVPGQVTGGVVRPTAPGVVNVTFPLVAPAVAMVSMTALN